MSSINLRKSKFSLRSESGYFQHLLKHAVTLHYAVQIINAEYLSGLVDFLSGFPLLLDILCLVI